MLLAQNITLQEKGMEKEKEISSLFMLVSPVNPNIPIYKLLPLQSAFRFTRPHCSSAKIERERERERERENRHGTLFGNPSISIGCAVRQASPHILVFP